LAGLMCHGCLRRRGARGRTLVCQLAIEIHPRFTRRDHFGWGRSYVRLPRMTTSTSTSGRWDRRASGSVRWKMSGLFSSDSRRTPAPHF
jgi:hypothetical protein